jgi:hypothetical protein
VGQLLADQGQEWMGIRTTSKEAGSPSKLTGDNREQRVGFNQALSDVKILQCTICKIIRFCVQVKNKPYERYTSYMRLISWIYPCGSETILLHLLEKLPIFIYV